MQEPPSTASWKTLGAMENGAVERAEQGATRAPSGSVQPAAASTVSAGAAGAAGAAGGCGVRRVRRRRRSRSLSRSLALRSLAYMDFFFFAFLYTTYTLCLYTLEYFLVYTGVCSAPRILLILLGHFTHLHSVVLNLDRNLN